MSTESTSSLTKQLVAAILDTAPTTTGGGTVREMIGTRIYVAHVPDNTAYPFVVVRLQSFKTDQTYSDLRATGQLEVTVFARPRTKAEDAEELTDRILQALVGYSNASRGFVFGTSYTRQTLPMFSEPGDKDVYALRVLFDFACWPLFLTGGTPAA